MILGQTLLNYYHPIELCIIRLLPMKTRETKEMYISNIFKVNKRSVRSSNFLPAYKK
jgi:hypothetical protein